MLNSLKNNLIIIVLFSCIALNLNAYSNYNKHNYIDNYPNYHASHNRIINDASNLNQTRVYDIIHVQSVNDIEEALKIAKDRKLNLSIAGVKHSMGGQAFFRNALVLDITKFNKILNLDKNRKIVKVQSGVTWHDLQIFLNKYNLAIKSMQSTDIFTIGGSLSVNAHGMDHRFGSVASSVRSFRILMADGKILNVTKENNRELFNLVIGGYGLFGIILEVELELTNNTVYTPIIKNIKTRDFACYFDKIQKNKDFELCYAHLSTSPITFFKQMTVYSYKKKYNQNNNITPLGPVKFTKTRNKIFNLAKLNKIWQIFKWGVEKNAEPFMAKFNPQVSRNQVMHDSVEYITNKIKNTTDILQEYFVPKNQINNFINKLALILKNREIILLNASVRFVPKESIRLNYAPEDMFAVVLFFNHKINNASINKIKSITQEIINLTLSLNGKFFLPYQLYFTKNQLNQAYPNINNFFKLKRKYDPELIFMNNFYSKYA